jgi:predicted nucleic acid-binding protein
MPEVIVNTSPLQYLYQTGLLELLPNYYRRVYVPEAVIDELERGRALGVSLPIVNHLSWVIVRKPQHPMLLPLASGLGAGESEVLALAEEITNATVVLDDRRARQYARLLNIKITGTLGILLKAKKTGGLPAVRPIIEQLQVLGFRVHAGTYKAVLRLAGE